MLFFSFFYGKKHQRQHTQHVPDDNCPRPNASDELTSEYEYDPATDNDRSYEDALLDSQLRLFVKAEYSRVEPPTGVFKKILLALEGAAGAGVVRPTRKQSPAPALKAFLTAFRSALSGQTAMRVLPGGLAMVMALSIGLAANTNRVLNTELAPMQQSGFVAPSIQVTHTTDVGQPLFTFPQASYSPTQDTGAQSSDSSYDVIGYDPYELLTPHKKDSSRDQTSRDYPEDRARHEWKNFDPQ